MDVIYSIGATLAGGGIGDTAFYAVSEIEKAGYLKKVMVTSYNEMALTKIDRSKIDVISLSRYFSMGLWGFKKYVWKDFQGVYKLNNLFDVLAASKLTSCDIFHGWNNQCLKSLKKGKDSSAITIVERASSHPLYQYKILSEEYSKFGVKENPNPLLERACKELEICDYVTIPSDFVRRSFIEYGYPEEKLIQIPFGVDLARFRGIKNVNSSNGHVVFLFAGIVGIRKGVHYLLQAWKELSLRNAELRICGSISSEFNKIFKKYENMDSIKFLGFVPDVREEFKKADVFIFPTLEEGSALVTYEAAASGLPIITTENSGSIAREGVDGFILPIRDIKALKDSIQYFYDNLKEIKRMGKNARENVESYTWENYGKNLMAEYKRVYETRFNV